MRTPGLAFSCDYRRPTIITLSMSTLNPPSSPPRTPYSPHTPGTPHTPYTPHTPGTPSHAGARTPNTPIPRPPASPLRRPNSPSSLRSAPQSGTATPRRASGSLASVSSSALGLEGRQGAGAGVERQKTRARELLRKHYGLGLGPPPPLGGAKSSQDPMDFGEHHVERLGRSHGLS